MTTGGISETGIQSNLISQQVTELKQQERKSGKGEESFSDTEDIINLTAGIWTREKGDIDAIGEDDARVLAQLVAMNLADQPFGIATEAGTEALRAFI